MSPVITSLIKKTKIKKSGAENYLFICSNSGIRLFLESKKDVLTKLLNNYLGQQITIIFNTERQSLKKRTRELPLINYQQKTEDIITKAGLSHDFTFNTFAVSSSNQIAYSAAINIAQNPGKIYNPFFIYGGVGVGKTHLA